MANAIGDGAMVWSPFQATLANPGYGVAFGVAADLDATPFSYVNSSPSPALTGHYWVKLNGAATKSCYMHILHDQDALTFANGVPAGARSALRFSFLGYYNGDYPNADNMLYIWYLNLSTWIILRLDSDGKLRLYRSTNLLATSTNVLAKDTVFEMNLWLITRDSAGNRIDDQWVLQIITDPFGSPTLTEEFNIQDTGVQSDWSNPLITEFWKAKVASLGNFSLYGHTFTVGWEDADNPSGVHRDALMLPSGAGSDNGWNGVGDATDKWKNVDEDPPATADYNWVGTLAETYQTHALPDSVAPSDNTVKFVNQLAWLADVGALGKSKIKLVIRDASVRLETAAYTPTTAWVNFRGASYGQIWKTAPDGGVWSPGDLDTLQIGYREGYGGDSAYVAATAAIPCFFDPDDVVDPPGPVPVTGTAFGQIATDTLVPNSWAGGSRRFGAVPSTEVVTVGTGGRRFGAVPSDESVPGDSDWTT